MYVRFIDGACFSETLVAGNNSDTHEYLSRLTFSRPFLAIGLTVQCPRRMPYGTLVSLPKCPRNSLYFSRSLITVAWASPLQKLATDLLMKAILVVEATKHLRLNFFSIPAKVLLTGREHHLDQALYI